VDGFKGDTEMLKTLTWFERVEQGQPDEPFVSTSVSNTDVYLILDTLFNVDAQLQKYRKDIEKIDKELLPLESRMSNENFVSRAKPEVVQKEREAIENLKLQKQRVLEKISMLEKIH
jgi:valyl-tRNA synthetase